MDSEASSGTVGLVRSIVVPLVDDKDAVDISSSFSDDGREYVEVRVAPDDIGKVIGRQGRVIKSIRVLARAAACSGGGNVEVEIVED